MIEAGDCELWAGGFAGCCWANKGATANTNMNWRLRIILSELHLNWNKNC
jgi:hypothetical protein